MVSRSGNLKVAEVSHPKPSVSSSFLKARNQFVLTRASPSLAETGCHFLNRAFNSHFDKTGSLTQGVGNADYYLLSYQLKTVASNTERSTATAAINRLLSSVFHYFSHKVNLSKLRTF